LSDWPSTLLGVTQLVGFARVGLLTAGLIAGVAISLLAGDIFTLLFFISYATAGSLLIARQPRNTIGWLLLATGWGLCFASLLIPPATAQALANGTASATDELIAWFTSWGWTTGFLSLLAITILFPSGRLPAGRWKIPAVVLLCVAALTMLVTAFAPTISVTPADEGQPFLIPNPVALVPDLPLWGLVPPDDTLILIVFAELALGAVGMIVRFRASRGIERLQLRWLVAALALLIVAGLFGLATFSVLDGNAWLPVAIAYPTVPAAITVAVLRYRLYDIDVLINRTALYGAVTLILAAALGLGNIAAQRLLQSVTGGQNSEIITAGLAVAAAFAFAPMSRRLRPIADRLLPSREMLTLFFTDIVESTRKAVELGDERWRDLLQRYRVVVRRDLGRFDGHEVDTAGDGFFVTFERPLRAVECALQMRADVSLLGLESRMGLHRGECQVRGEKVTGVAVHAAARVMAHAREGEILVSDAVRDSISDHGFTLTDRGAHELKGVPGEWRLYALDARTTDP
jgi:class 3 adenylate cyclase